MPEPDELAMALLNRWIPVSERLPKAEEEVLTFGSQGRVIGYVGVLGCWHSVHSDCETSYPWLCDPGTVTHWMPLPPPPATPPAPPT
jgi:hypothetical protein